MFNPLLYQLFQEYIPIKMHKKGLNRLFNCYLDNLKRIKAVYQQEVLKTKYRNRQNKKIVKVVRMKVKDY